MNFKKNDAVRCKIVFDFGKGEEVMYQAAFFEKKAADGSFMIRYGADSGAPGIYKFDSYDEAEGVFVS